MSEVTRLLEAANRGDRKAAAELLPVVYDELRKLAAARMAAENPGHTLNATALVHEAYLRLIGDQQFDGRGRRRIDLDRVTSAAAATDDDLVGLGDAINRQASEYPAAAELMKLRFFAGMTLGAAADALDQCTELLTGTGASPARGWRTPCQAGRLRTDFWIHWHTSGPNGASGANPPRGDPCPTPAPA